MRRRYRIILELELMEDKEPESFDWQDLLQLTIRRKMNMLM